MDLNKDVKKLDIPAAYDHPKRDAVEVKMRLDEELKRETNARQKSVSGEFRLGYSNRPSTSAETPDRRIPVPRMNSNASDSSDKLRKPRTRVSRSDKGDEPFTAFSDFETSAWPSPQTSENFDNPFRMQEWGNDDSLYKSLSLAPAEEIETLIRSLVRDRPSLRSVIHSALSQ